MLYIKKSLLIRLCKAYISCFSILSVHEYYSNFFFFFHFYAKPKFMQLRLPFIPINHGVISIAILNMLYLKMSVFETHIIVR